MCKAWKSRWMLRSLSNCSTGYTEIAQAKVFL